MEKFYKEKEQKLETKYKKEIETIEKGPKQNIIKLRNSGQKEKEHEENVKNKKKGIKLKENNSPKEKGERGYRKEETKKENENKKDNVNDPMKNKKRKEILIKKF